MTLKEIIREIGKFYTGDALDPMNGLDENEAVEQIKRWALEMVGVDIKWTDGEARQFSTDLARARFFETAINMEKQLMRDRIEESE